MTALAPQLLVVGASARAAVWSARSLGPIAAIDQYGDADLRESANVVVSSNYPHDLIGLARRFPACPWIYTGALENHPRIVRRIAAERPLLGNDADVLERIRDPFAVAESLAAAGLPYLEVRRPDDPPPPDGEWVLRPRQSAAGRRIELWTATARRPTPGDLFQRLATGESFSAVFLARRDHVTDVGATRQLFRAGRPFEWAGNVGPLALPSTTADAVRRIAEHLTSAFRLRGLFGIDFVLENDVPLPVEINPRYTASVEVHERALGRSLLVEHVQSTRDEATASPPPRHDVASDRCVLKRVLFVSTAVESTCAWSPDRSPEGVAVADVPCAGTHIPAGQPLCTLLVDGTSAAECLERAVSAAANFVAELGGTEWETLGD